MSQSTGPRRLIWMGTILTGIFFAATPEALAVPTAWQLLDDGDPSPGNWPLVFDSVRQRAVLETGGSIPVGGPDGPSIHWELVGNDWVRVWLPEPTPKQRTELCTAFDSARGVMVVFGAGLNYDETWEFNGSTWSHKTPASSPPGRGGCAMSFDPVNLRSVMFGGTNGTTLGDTWEWDGTTWVQIFPSSSPIPRLNATMTYDASAQRIVLFGGNAGNAVNDTWYYDVHRHRWTQQSPSTSPQSRWGAGLAYDPVRKRDVMFGGESNLQLYADTWEWDGRNWIHVTTSTAPQPRENFRMIYDTSRGSVVGFGGGPDPRSFSDTWSYNGVTWTQLITTTLPPPRMLFGMAYDPTVGGLVLSGGHSALLVPPGWLSDTWHYVGGVWTPATLAGAPSDVAAFPLDLDPASGDPTGFSGWSSNGLPNNSDVHTYGGTPPVWTSVPTPGPDPRGEQAWTYSASLNGFLMFGGHACCFVGSLYIASDTWLLSGGAWSELVGSNLGPSPRTGAVMAYDSLRGRVILYGGSPNDGIAPLLSSTYEYADGRWTELQNPSPPGGRGWHGMTYDADRDAIVMFGAGPNLEGVTWEFDGTSWIAQPTPFEPDSSRSYFQMVYDPIKHVTYLFGGADLNVAVYYQDFWAYGPDPDGDGKVGGLDNCPGVANPTQVNVDGDPAGDACDCAPSDPSAWGAAQLVSGLALTGQITTSLTWNDQSAAIGSGVRYDVATGDLLQLHANGSYAPATCLVDQTATPSASDGRMPAAGQGFYYLVRSRNACGLGSYGAGPLDTASPCP